MTVSVYHYHDRCCTTGSGGKTKSYTVVLPYVSRVSEQLRRVFMTYNITAYFKPMNTLRRFLVNPKDTIDKQNVVRPVCHIQCYDYEASYVGQTERSQNLYLQAHKRQSSVTYEVSHHVNVDKLHHSVSLDNVNILTVENKKFERGMNEVIHIHVSWHHHSTRTVGVSYFQQCGPTC